MSNRQITIDPGCPGGWVVWAHPAETTIIATGIAGMGGYKDALPAAKYVVEQIRTAIKIHKPVSAICEYPQFNESAGGQVVASSGALVKLSVVAGRIWQMCEDAGLQWKWVEAGKWKATMPKDLVNARVREILGDHTCKQWMFRTHIWDAAGIGLYSRGLFQ